MEKLVIAGIGEILFDILGDNEELGGAPVNFAFHCNELGARGYPVSTIGEDRRGEKALAQLRKRNLATSCITTVPQYPTGYVTATIDEQGVASYDFPDEIAWDHLRINSEAKHLAHRLDAVCFGSLAQRSQESKNVIHDYLASTPDKTLKVFDLNLRQNFYSRDSILASLQVANLLKLNDEELPVLAQMTGINGDDRQQLVSLCQQFGLDMTMLTRGGSGSLLVTPEQSSDHPGIKPAKLADTIGAGDSFTATAVICYLLGIELDEINEMANRVAAFVCSRQGAMPALPDYLQIT